MPPAADLSGFRHPEGRLTVRRRGPNTPAGKAAWVCECDCGAETGPIPAANLTRGRTLSCGCLRAECQARPLPGPGGGCGWCDPAGGERFCSDACRRAALNARDRAARGPLPTGTCRVCRRPFTAGKRARMVLYCSGACNAAAASRRKAARRAGVDLLDATAELSRRLYDGDPDPAAAGPTGDGQHG